MLTLLLARTSFGDSRRIESDLVYHSNVYKTSDAKSSFGLILNPEAEWILARRKTSAVFLKTAVKASQYLSEANASRYLGLVDIEQLNVFGRNSELSLRGVLSCEDAPVFQTTRLIQHTVFGSLSWRQKLKKQYYRLISELQFRYFQGEVDGRITPNQTMELPYKDDVIVPALSAEWGGHQNDSKWSLRMKLSFWEYLERRASRTDGSIRDPSEYEELETERSLKSEFFATYTHTLEPKQNITAGLNFARNKDLVFGGENFNSLGFSIKYLINIQKLAVTVSYAKTNQVYDEKRSDPADPIDSPILEIETSELLSGVEYRMGDKLMVQVGLKQESLDSSFSFDSFNATSISAGGKYVF